MIDIVSKDRYNCAKENIEATTFRIVGDIQKPVYGAKIKKRLKKNNQMVDME